MAAMTGDIQAGHPEEDGKHCYNEHIDQIRYDEYPMLSGRWISIVYTVLF